MPRLRPFFSYFGAKWRLAPTYPAPRYGTIVEPFAGSACYSLLYPHLDVVLVEKDPRVAALWRYLVRAKGEEIRAIPLIAAGQSVEDLETTEGGRLLVSFWLARASAGPRQDTGAWFAKHSEKYRGSFWSERTRERVASQVDRIRHWRVIEGDYSQAPDVEATWFVDPPYQVAGKSYREGAGTIDYQELGEWCRLRQGQVVVCENEGATWLPFARHRETQGLAKRSVESVWVQ